MINDCVGKIIVMGFMTLQYRTVIELPCNNNLLFCIYKHTDVNVIHDNAELPQIQDNHQTINPVRFIFIRLLGLRKTYK